MLFDSDVERLDGIMANIKQRRADRGANIPHRDNEKIAEVLRNAEKRAFDEHLLLTGSKEKLASAFNYQSTLAKEAEGDGGGKKFPKLNRYRIFD